MTNDNHDETNATDSTDTDTNKPDWWDDLEDGQRADAVVDDSRTERHYLRDDGKRYWFDLREPTWQKKSQLTDEALVITRNSRELDTTQYYRDMLEYMVEDASIDIKNFATFMAGARAGLADKLTSIVPAPGNNIEEDEEGNSDGPSETERKEDTTPPASATTDA